MLLLLNGKKILFDWATVVTTLLMIVFVFIAGSNLQYNTAFVDEAIYANVGEEFMRQAYWDAPLSWMGGSYAYPVMSATINRLWGLWGIRMASTLMVLVVAWCVGIIGKRVAGNWGRPLAIGFYLFSAPTLSVAQLATYDAPSMMTFTIGALALILSLDQRGWKKYLLITLSGLMVGGSILIKYVTILVTAPLALLHITAKKQWFLGGLFWGWILVAMISPYVYLNHTDLYAYATGGNSIEITSRLRIFLQMLEQIPSQFMGAVLTALLLIINRNKGKKDRMWMILLIGTAPIIYHLGSGNIRSFNKHLSLATVMWAPLSAWSTITISKMYKHYRLSHGLVANSMQLINSIVLIAIFTSLWTTFSIHWRFERSWPSASKTVEYLDKRLNTGDKVFAEGAATYKYHLFRGFGDPSAWPSTWYYQRDGKYGTDAMKDAIKNREFRYIILNKYFTSETDEAILPTVVENYEPVFEEKYLLSGVHEMTTTVWEKKSNLQYGFFDLLVKSDTQPNLI